MAELRLERHPAVVEQDLPEIYAFIARDDPAAAERILEAVEAGFLQLTRHPESGVAFPTRNPRLKRMRMLPLHGLPNYLIFYGVEPESIRIPESDGRSAYVAVDCWFRPGGQRHRIQHSELRVVRDVR